MCNNGWKLEILRPTWKINMGQMSSWLGSSSFGTQWPEPHAPGIIELSLYTAKFKYDNIEYENIVYNIYIYIHVYICTSITGIHVNICSLDQLDGVPETSLIFICLGVCQTQTLNMWTSNPIQSKGLETLTFLHLCLTSCWVAHDPLFPSTALSPSVPLAPALRRPKGSTSSSG